MIERRFDTSLNTTEEEVCDIVEHYFKSKKDTWFDVTYAFLEQKALLSIHITTLILDNLFLYNLECENIFSFLMSQESKVKKLSINFTYLLMDKDNQTNFKKFCATNKKVTYLSCISVNFYDHELFDNFLSSFTLISCYRFLAFSYPESFMSNTPVNICEQILECNKKLRWFYPISFYQDYYASCFQHCYLLDFLWRNSFYENQKNKNKRLTAEKIALELLMCKNSRKNNFLNQLDKSIIKELACFTFHASINM